MSSLRPVRKTILLGSAVAVAIVLTSFALRPAKREDVRSILPAETSPIATASTPMAASLPRFTPSPADNPASTKPQTFAWFRPKPFIVARSSGQHEWTAEDGRDPNVILDLAHNDSEVERLMKENDRVTRRQLVYRKEPVWIAVERSKATGEPVRKLMLPAFDGRQVEVEVTSADIAPSGMSGTLSGRVTANPQSLATIAFYHAREAFTIVSPEDGTFLQGHPREPGEIIVTSFNPDTYTLPGGEPIAAAR